jgi:hypothetical protein
MPVAEKGASPPPGLTKLRAQYPVFTRQIDTFMPNKQFCLDQWSIHDLALSKRFEYLSAHERFFQRARFNGTHALPKRSTLKRLTDWLKPDT